MTVSMVLTRRFRTRMMLKPLRILLPMFITLVVLGVFVVMSLQPQPLHISQEDMKGFVNVKKRPVYLSITEDYTMTKESIFLMETSGSETLSPRQCCAIESAARHHPNTNVYLLVKSKYIKLQEPLLGLIKLPNIQLRYLDYNAYFNDTPLQKLQSSGKLARSSYPVVHMSDVLRLLTLWKYGGIYLDLDTVMLRSFSNLSDCAGLESEKWIGTGVLKMKLGSPVVESSVWKLARNFKGHDWGHNGPKLITRVLMQWCNRTRWNNPPINCKGVQVLPKEAFYAVYPREWESLFLENNWEQVLDKFSSSYVLHTWNKRSSKAVVVVGSRQPYARLALRHCPYTYFHSGKTFS